MPVDYRELADRLVEIVKERTGDFVSQRADVADFLRNRAKRLAKLMVKLAAADEAEVPAIQADIAFVRQTIDTELAAVAVDASTESRKTFKAVLSTVFDMAGKALPLLMAAL